MAYSTIAILKSYLGIPSAASSEDTALTAALNAATQEINNLCGRDFEPAGSTSIKTYRPDTDTILNCDDIARTDSGLTIKIDTTDYGTFDTTLAASAYEIDGNSAPYRRIIRVDGNLWPRYYSNRRTIQVTAYHSYGTAVPYPVQQAATILGARLYQRRSSVLGVTAGTAETGVFRISRQDPELNALLRGYRLFAVA